MAVAALLLTVNWTSYVWAVVNDHVIETALGYFMAPLGTILIGVLVFGEHLRRAQKSPSPSPSPPWSCSGCRTGRSRGWRW